MEVLGGILNLRTLYLNCGAYSGKEIICREISFQQLKDLLLCSLDNFEKWRVDEGAMPKLALLEIEYCEKLEIDARLSRGYRCLALGSGRTP